MTKTDAASHPLDGSRGKLVRAVQQAVHLQDHSAAYAEMNPYILASKFENDAHYGYLSGRPPPLYLGLILGEVVHDLRSALDQLAWQLAIKHVGPDTLADPRVGKLIVFPITSSPEAFAKHRARPYFDRDALTTMDGLQPYQNASSRLVNPLAIVQEWSNTDKHRSLTPSLGQLSTDDVRFVADAAIDINSVELLLPESTVIDPSAPLLRIPAPADTTIRFEPIPAKVCFLTHTTGAPDIVFADKIRPLCEQIGEAVGVFEPAFPEVEWSGRVESWTTPPLP